MEKSKRKQGRPKMYDNEKMGIITIYTDLDRYQKVKEYCRYNGKGTFSRLVNDYLDSYIEKYEDEINYAWNNRI